MKKFLLALLLGLGSLAQAQSLPILPRSTRANGLGDTSLYMTSDTARRTRAVTTLDLRRVLSVTAFDSLITGKLRLTSSVVGSATWTGLQTFAAGQLVDSATGAARSQILTTTRTLWGQSFNGSANLTAAPTFGAGATVSSGQTLTLTGATVAGAPTWSSVQSFAATQRVDSSTGAARASALVGSPAITVSSCTGCSGALTAADIGTGTFPSGTYGWTGATTLTGGAGNMVIAAGTGNSRTMTLRSTTSAGTAKNTMILGTDSSVALLGRIKAWGTVSEPAYALPSGTGTFNNGFYAPSPGSDSVSLSLNGSSRFIWTSNTMAAPTGSLTLTGSTTGAVLLGEGNNAWVTIGLISGNRQALFNIQGAASAPVLAIGATNLGFYKSSTDTLITSIAGVRGLSFSGGANSSLIGGAGNMTIQAGSGNNRFVTLGGTSSAGSYNGMWRVSGVQASGYDGSVTAPGIAFFNDSSSGWARLGSGNYINLVKSATNIAAFGLTGDTLATGRFSLDTSGTITGSARNMTITAGTGASRTLTLNATNASSAVIPGLVVNADTSVNISGNRFQVIPGATPYAFSNGAFRSGLTNCGATVGFHSSAGTAVGLCFPGSDTVMVSNSSGAGMRFTGGASTKMVGGAGNMTIQAGTGNSRTMTLQATNGSGTPQNNVVLNADGSTTMGVVTVTSCTGCGGGGSSPVLDSQITGAGINSTGTNTTLFSYTIPANTLTANGQTIEVYWNVQCFQGEANDQMRILIGSFTHTLTQGTSGAGGMNTTRITRVDATHVNIETQSMNWAGPASSAGFTGRTQNGAVSDLASNTLAISVAGGGTTVGVCTGWQMTTRKLY